MSAELHGDGGHKPPLHFIKLIPYRKTGGEAGPGSRRLPLKFWLVLAMLPVADGAAAAEPAPVLFQSGRGRFEIAAVDASAARTVTGMAEDAWRFLAGPLALPEAFSSPVLVRLVPQGDSSARAPFRTVVEAGGIVSVVIGWNDNTPAVIVQRALVQGLLLRLAVAHHGVNERLTAPLWLEHGCVGWWQTRADAAQFDALKQETARLDAPALGELLEWRRGAGEPRAHVVGSSWLLAVLQSESGRAGLWPGALQRLLAGDDPMRVVAAGYGAHFANEDERELWWRTGWHHLRRVRALPTPEAAESRAELAALARFVFARDETDEVVPLRTVLAHAGEPIVEAELRRRATDLRRLLTSLHPFYRNAGLSLAEAFDASRSRPERREALCGVFDQDWRDAMELEAATTAALDALEKKIGAGVTGQP
ncbi:MAG: hypothetical protein HY736_18430 [Verrucomicrobia bacterium]|nr:hypothetical protein [Verrucomicrobiota bacterium]